MRKYLIIGIALVLGVKYGIGYLLSDKFEMWADQTKHPGSCYFENFAGQMHILMSDYKSGTYRFSHTLARCPGTSMAEEALYGYARCLEGSARRPEAADTYELYAKKYPRSDRARTALKAADILRGI